MDFEKAKALVDAFVQEQERFEREMGGPEVIQWMLRELRRREQPRETGSDAEDVLLTDAPPAAPMGSLRDEPSGSLIRRVEVLEAQLRHLTRRLETERLI